MMTELPPLDSAILPPGIRARFVENVNGLRMHVLEAGFETPGRPCLLLLHGFPELAYSWRKVMGPLAAAGFHVVAPDQRGYGRTTGWDRSYDGDVASFRLFNLVRDALGLVAALGYSSVAAVIGHDFGSPVAAWCALLRPDVFPAVAMMSAPFPGPPSLNAGASSGENIHAALAKLDRPRKHYQWYYSTRAANAAQMPTYYIMDLHQDMAATVASEMPSAEAIAACQWLPDAELAIYSGEFKRTGFQGGLQWYRCRTENVLATELEVFSGRTIDMPSLFIAGKSDWGTYQFPRTFERMQRSACTRMLGCHLVDGAGHWVQQEQPEQVKALLLEFLQQCPR